MKRTIIIADSHGRPELITNSLDHAKYNKSQDHLIFAGDFMDIGPYPEKCLDVLLENNAELLWGKIDIDMQPSRKVDR